MSLVSFVSLWFATSLPADGRKAVLHLRNPAAAGVEIPFVEVYDLKLNRERKLAVGKALQYTRNAYRKLASLDFDQIQKMQWSEQAPGQIQIQTTVGQQITCHCVPAGVSFTRGMTVLPSSSMETAVLEGHFVILGRRTRRRLQMKDVGAILFVPESRRLDEVAFRQAQERNTAASWTEFIQAFPGSQWVGAARTKLAQAGGQPENPRPAGRATGTRPSVPRSKEPVRTTRVRVLGVASEAEARAIAKRFSRLAGVRSVQESSFTLNLAEYELKATAEPKELAARLAGVRTESFSFQLLEVTPQTVRLRIISR